MSRAHFMQRSIPATRNKYGVLHSRIRVMVTHCEPANRAHYFDMRKRTERLPWAKELLFLLSLSGFRLIVWDKASFKASGIGSTLFLGIQSLSLIVYAVFFKSSEAIEESLLPRRFDHSPIKSDLDAFLTAVYMTEICLTAVYVIVVAWKREELAQALNHLNSLWLS